MSHWKYKLNIKNEWKACKEGTLSLKELVSSVIKKLQSFSIQEDDELEDIIEEFKMFNEQEEEEQDVDEFDGIWERLYDWADQTLDSMSCPHKKMCWVETF